MESKSIQFTAETGGGISNKKKERDKFLLLLLRDVRLSLPKHSLCVSLYGIFPISMVTRSC
jgi:hypothetical protein